MKARDYLLQIERINSIIQNKQIELDQWKEIVYGTTAPMECERVQSSGDMQRLESAVVRYVDIEARIMSEVEALIEKKNEIIHTIEQLPVEEYEILHMAYVQMIDLNDCADIKGKSKSWATSMHGNALVHLQELINGKAK